MNRPCAHEVPSLLRGLGDPRVAAGAEGVATSSPDEEAGDAVEDRRGSDRTDASSATRKNGEPVAARGIACTYWSNARALTSGTVSVGTSHASRATVGEDRVQPLREAAGTAEVFERAGWTAMPTRTPR